MAENEAQRSRCACGHVGETGSDGIFHCNVCAGKGRVAEPWPGSEGKVRVQGIYRQNLDYYIPTENLNDPAWWEPHHPDYGKDWGQEETDNSSAEGG
jgi:hypothetical protein